MCITREEIKNIMTEENARRDVDHDRKELEREERRTIDLDRRFFSVKEDLDKSISLRMKHLTPSEETDRRLKALESWRKWLIGIFVANFVGISIGVFAIGQWTSEVSGGIESNAKNIQSILEREDDILNTKDAALFGAQIQEINRRLDKIEKK